MLFDMLTASLKISRRDCNELVPLLFRYTHSYAASTAWQPHKATLIVQNGEARMVYPSPSSEVDTAINNVRQSNRFQAALSFDLKGYAGGRVGVWM